MVHSHPTQSSSSDRSTGTKQKRIFPPRDHPLSEALFHEYEGRRLVFRDDRSKLSTFERRFGLTENIKRFLTPNWNGERTNFTNTFPTTDSLFNPMLDAWSKFCKYSFFVLRQSAQAERQATLLRYNTYKQVLIIINPNGQKVNNTGECLSKVHLDAIFAKP